MEPCCHRFTAAEGGARLAATAAAGNTLVTECGAFIATRLLHEEAYNIRGLLSSGRQRSIHIGRAANVKPDAYDLTILTDLKVTQAVAFEDVADWSQELETKEVVVCTSAVFRQILERGLLDMGRVNVLVINSCHMIYKDEDLQYIMQVYKGYDETKRPRILAITYPIFKSTKTTECADEPQTNEIAVIDKDSDDKLAIDNVFEPVSDIKRSIRDLGVHENLDDFEMYETLEYKIDQLEQMLCCRMDLAEDIDGCKRISGPTMKPKEILIEYSEEPPLDEMAPEYRALDHFMRDAVCDVMLFLEDHRHDPTEIYGEEMYEELKSIPDPTTEPMQIFNEFLYILDELGPYGADKAAFTLLIKLEKLKIRVPYERHFLLLRMCTTTLVKVRCHAETTFSHYESDWDKIRLFSTPKLMRLVEILERFTPADLRASIDNNTYVRTDRRTDYICNKGDDKNDTDSNRDDFKKRMLSDIDRCDFTSLGDRILDKLNTVEANLKDLDINDADDPKETSENDRIITLKTQGVRREGRGGRAWRRRTPRVARVAPHSHSHSHPDALCGLVYVNEPLLAKILFALVVDISRCVAGASYINAQYCAVEPTRGSDECRKQGRRHEEVLKKFRMHECNLLVTTRALEEGIDLPRCNLVLRWDEPVSYRSHAVSRGRCRAWRGCSALLAGAASAPSALHRLATYRELDHIITRKCGCGIQDEPPSDEEAHADTFNFIIRPYTPYDAVKRKEPCVCKTKHNEKYMNIKRTINNDNDHKNVGKNDQNVINHSNNDNTVYTKDSSVIICEDQSDVIGNDCKNSGNRKVISINKNDSNDINHDKVIIVSSDINNDKVTIDNSDINNDTVIIGNSDINHDKVIIDNANSKILNNDDQIGDKCDVNDNDDEHEFVNGNDGHSDEISENDAKNSDINSVKCSCNKNDSDNVASVDLNSAIALINRYCAKLPSDTFTRLAPQWWMERVRLPGDTRDSYICTLRLPLNCPVKYNIGHPMSSRVLARRVVALQACRVLHATGELDHQLMPIGKETFKAMDLDSAQPVPDPQLNENDARPGTTKRRQYYYKRTAWAFTDCEPVVDTSDTELENRNDPAKPESTDNEIKQDITDAEEMEESVEINSLKREKSAKPELDSLKPRLVETNPTNDDLDSLKSSSPKPRLVQTNSTNDGLDSLETSKPGLVHSIPSKPLVETPSSEPVQNSAKLDSAADSQKASEKPQDEFRSTEEPTEGVKSTGGKRNMLYAIECRLWCALPERYNTRGRQLHAPQHATQALAVLMARHEPADLQIPAFPVYTRSGEVRVSVELVPDADVRVSPRRGRLVRRFMRFVFTEVLRVRRRGMALHSAHPTARPAPASAPASAAPRNNYYVVPTLKSTRADGTKKIEVDWEFLEQIYEHTERQKLSPDKPPLWLLDEEEQDECHQYNAREQTEASVPVRNPTLKDGEVFVFDPELYREAVVTPWYRNQDQPQFFLVAEICTSLSPDSAFPSPAHETFRTYYQAKYKVELTQPNQPLLDVDHTSARLNLLTPRYVNRKGVALPVSSERTRRAKRDRLDQKQILVPELCTVHPFASPLWFATVALPCVLYRINALLIADEIRRAVAVQVGLGIPKLDKTTAPGFHWPPLDFGWCLAEVLNADVEKSDSKSDDGSDDDETTRVVEEKKVEEEKSGEGDEGTEDNKEKTINEILQEEHEKLTQDDTESGFEIGTWSNDMASSIPDVDDIYDEWSEPLPHNLTFCTSANGGVNWCDPVQKPKSEYNPTKAYTMADSDCSYMSSDFDSDDSDFDTDGGDTEGESGFGSSKAVNASLGVRIEYKSAHEAEAVDLEVSKKTCPAPARPPADERADRAELVELLTTGDADQTYIDKFRQSVESHKRTIVESGLLVKKEHGVCELLPEARDKAGMGAAPTDNKLHELFPYDDLEIVDGQISIESIEKNKRKLLNSLKESLPEGDAEKLHCFFMKDINIDDPSYVNEKIANVGFDSKEKYVEMVRNYRRREYKPYYDDCRGLNGKEFNFDYQPDLDGHPGPSPSLILQALTMSNANDGINLERLETIGDSFLKFAITAYLYCALPTVHEGKLSHMRSKQVSNLNLYRLGRAARLGARMIASKFEPHDNWLPPCHRAPTDPHHRQTDAGDTDKRQEAGCYIPYNLITQHSIPDKSIADCVEALIGAYLLECGPRGALLFMSWLGISVLPHHKIPLTRTTADSKKTPASSLPRRARASSISSCSSSGGELEDPSEGDPWEGETPCGPPGTRRPSTDDNGDWYQVVYGELKAPPSPLLRYIRDPDGELERMLSGYDALEGTLQYRFRDRSLLLQALTHASHQRNTLTDCYQRLEFLGDAILDYLITRHLYEDGRRHSPGALTDLRSALVNNTIFATLCVRHGFHKYFRHMSPGLNEVLMKYVKIQEENGHSISEEHYLIHEDELEQAEDVEVPKALGDLFESIAGAIFLDSGMSLGAVWHSYVRLMGAELEAFSARAPKSPVRELLEAEPDTAKFSKPERLADGRRVRVCVEVFGRGTFKGIGRNYRIAKGTAARCALRHLRTHRR